MTEQEFKEAQRLAICMRSANDEIIATRRLLAKKLEQITVEFNAGPMQAAIDRRDSLANERDSFRLSMVAKYGDTWRWPV